jgi:hypothetical protein
VGATSGKLVQRTISAVGLLRRLACATRRATSAAWCGCPLAGAPNEAPSTPPLPALAESRALLRPATEEALRAEGLLLLLARAMMMWPSWPDAFRPSSAAVRREAPGCRNWGSCGEQTHQAFHTP